MSELSDLEITRKCAEAMGIITKAKLGTWEESRYADEWKFDPLRDDADAMALVKRFKLSIYQHQDLVTVTDYFYSQQRVELNITDLNRAICLTVARMKGEK